MKPSPKLKRYTDGKGVLKAGGVGNGRVLVWHTFSADCRHVVCVGCMRFAGILIIRKPFAVACQGLA